MSETMPFTFPPKPKRFFSKKNQSIRITANAKTAIPVVIDVKNPLTLSPRTNVKTKNVNKNQEEYDKTSVLLIFPKKNSTKIYNPNIKKTNLTPPHVNQSKTVDSPDNTPKIIEDLTFVACQETTNK